MLDVAIDIWSWVVFCHSHTQNDTAHALYSLITCKTPMPSFVLWNFPNWRPNSYNNNNNNKAEEKYELSDKQATATRPAEPINLIFICIVICYVSFVSANISRSQPTVCRFGFREKREFFSMGYYGTFILSSLLEFFDGEMLLLVSLCVELCTEFQLRMVFGYCTS